MDNPDHAHTGSNGRAELTLDDFAALHGGLAHFMVEISDRTTRCYQALQAHNRQVARHQLGELTKSLRLAILVRPQYREAIEQFISEDLEGLRAVIASEEWGQLEETWERLSVAVNAYHEKFDHGYLKWRVPVNAPSDLDLAAGA